MKQKLMYGWTITRGLYLLVGIYIMIHFAVTKEWIGILFGAYFAAMGALGFGCAGSCCGGSCARSFDPNNQNEETIEEVK